MKKLELQWVCVEAVTHNSRNDQYFQVELVQFICSFFRILMNTRPFQNEHRLWAETDKFCTDLAIYSVRISTLKELEFL